jgi:5-deoxy-glucuronate isomerase
VKIDSLIRAGEQTKFISLDLITAEPEDLLVLGEGTERLVVILAGRARVVLDGLDCGVAGGRHDVFEGAGDAVYIPPASSVELVPIADGDATTLTAAVIATPASEHAPGPARVIPAAEQRENVVGRDNWSRTVRNILGPDAPASRLIVGETIHNGMGAWSSFPPHRHDRESAEEAQLEEVYYYRVHPANGFALQARYDIDSAREDVWMAHDGDAAAITSGFHPVVAAPGHDLYYLWILAGEVRVMRVYLDPRYRWLNEHA